MSWRLLLNKGAGAGILGVAQTAVRNQVWKTPEWFSAMYQAPPLVFPPSASSRELNITYPEERLRTKLLQRKPEYKHATYQSFSEGDPRWYTHPVDIFVSRQLHYMKKGLSEDQAFAKVEEDLDEQQMILDLEKKFAEQQAMNMQVEHKSVKSLKAKVNKYKQAAVAFREEGARKRRETLEALLEAKKNQGDVSPFTMLELQGIFPVDVLEHLKLYPEEAFYFPVDILAQIKVDREKFVSSVDFEPLTYVPPPDFSNENIFTTRVAKGDTLTSANAEVKPKRTEEIDAFDAGLNPVLEKELQAYLDRFSLRDGKLGELMPTRRVVPGKQPSETGEAEVVQEDEEFNVGTY